MGLIIKKKLPMLLAGYPTVSDKYGVQGGILGGSTAAHYGDVLVFGSEQGEYEVAAAGATAAEVAGIVLATNIKLVRQFPGGSNATNATFEVGEALNVCINGYIAVPVAVTDITKLVEGADVYLNANGKLTEDSTGALLAGWKFTGIYEDKGTAGAPAYVAEIKFNI